MVQSCAVGTRKHSRFTGHRTTIKVTSTYRVTCLSFCPKSLIAIPLPVSLVGLGNMPATSVIHHCMCCITLSWRPALLIHRFLLLRSTADFTDALHRSSINLARVPLQCVLRFYLRPSTLRPTATPSGGGARGEERRGEERRGVP